MTQERFITFKVVDFFIFTEEIYSVLRLSDVINVTI